MARRLVDQRLVEAECLMLPVVSFPMASSVCDPDLPADARCCASAEDDVSFAGCSLSPASTLESSGVVCLCCDVRFTGIRFRDQMAEHLLTGHRLVVADIHLVPCLGCYSCYWAPRLQGDGGLKEYCFTILTNTAPLDTHPSEEYFLLSPKLGEDRRLRERLQQRLLQRVLGQHQLERKIEDFSRGCLFCRDQISSNLAAYFNHLMEKHNFSVGRPDKLVFAEELINTVEAKLESMRCLFCDGEFKERAILKEHMRKKQHKMLNPKEKAYDRFYVVNYLEIGKTWMDLAQEPDELAAARSDPTSDDEDEWSDWQAESTMGAVCLFCSFCCADVDQLKNHMESEHEFSLAKSVEKLNPSFYSQVKLVNFIRRQVHERKCISCECAFETTSDLLKHMHQQDHLHIPDEDVWNQPQYFFPTFENDTLLHMLPDSDGVELYENVLVEDRPSVRGSVLDDEKLRSELGCTT